MYCAKQTEMNLFMMNQFGFLISDYLHSPILIQLLYYDLIHKAYTMSYKMCIKKMKQLAIPFRAQLLRTSSGHIL